MLCPKCGSEVGDDIALCPKCTEGRATADTGHIAAPADEDAVEDAAEQSGAEESTEKGTGGGRYVGYGGFWLRFIALLIDTPIVKAIATVLASLIVGHTFDLISQRAKEASAKGAGISTAFVQELIVSLLPLLGQLLIVYVVVGWLYYTLLESSPLRGTIGKIVLSVRVVDRRLEQVSFLRASARHFAKILSSLLFCLGFFMAGFTKRKQGLHDLISGCVVVRNSHPSMLRVVLVLVVAIILNIVTSASLTPEMLGIKPGTISLDKLKAVAKTEPPASVEPAAMELPVTSGSVSAGEREIMLTASFALYNPLRRRLEVGFYQKPLSLADRAEIKRVSTLDDVLSNRPDVVVRLDFNDKAQGCNKDQLRSYSVLLKSNPGGLPVADRYKFWESAFGIDEFECTFEEGSPLVAGFKQEAYKATRGGEMVIRWDMRASGKIVFAAEEVSLQYASRTARAQVAIWNEEGNTVEIGFFQKRVPADERAEIRARKSMLALQNKKPVVVITLDLRKGEYKLSSNILTRYGVTFYRNADAEIDFPPDVEKVNFFYVPSAGVVTQFSSLSGLLKEREPLIGVMKHDAKKNFGKVPYRFSWDLSFDTPLIDVLSVSGRERRGAALRDEIPTKEPAVSGFFARAAAGSVGVDFRSVFGLFYPRDGDLAVGFYAEDLTEKDKEAIRDKRFLWSYVNNKRPNMVMFFDFKRDEVKASPQGVLSLTTYFYRDKIGAFYFRGPHDRVSFKRQPEEMAPGEIQLLQGTLEEGSTLKVRMKGSRMSKRTNVKFSWDFNVTFPIKEVW